MTSVRQQCDPHDQAGGALMDTKDRIALVASSSLLFLAALTMRLVGIDSAPGDNEIFHILAARSWLQDGTFSIAYGAYQRNPEFTALLGLVFQTFGESPAIARMPAALAGSLMVVVLFLWMRLTVGRAAAWIAAVLLCVCPLAIYISQFVRAYAFQGLAFFGGSICVYALATATLSHVARLIAGLLGAALLALAINLHILSLIGIACLALWLIFEYLDRVKSLLGRSSNQRWLFVGALALLLAAGALVLVSGEADRLLRLYRDLPPQKAYQQNPFWYYHNWFAELYPLLWGAFPVAAIFAIVRRRSFGLFCVIILLAALLVHSFAARKGLRYIYYLLPFFFATWGYVIAETIPFVKRLCRDAANVLLGDEQERIARWSGALALVLVALFVIASNSVLIPIVDALAGKDQTGPNWEAAAERLAPWLNDEQAVVIVSPMQAPLYYYGRADIEFGPKYIYQSDTDREFGTDWRTGLKAISSRESLELVFACFSRGLLLMDSSRWRKPYYGPDNDGFEVLTRHAEQLALPSQWQLTAYTWDLPATIPPPECSQFKPLHADQWILD